MVGHTSNSPPDDIATRHWQDSSGALDEKIARIRKSVVKPV